MWFEELVGFAEDDVDEVASQFKVDGEHLTSLANGRRMRHGRFETPSLGELRHRARRPKPGRLNITEEVADVQQLHLHADSAGALFQVASQFNTLEMVAPSVTPEDGIGRYEHDRTQGPACAVACGAGTIFRNYLVPIEGQRGQSARRQINCLSGVTEALDVPVRVENGYALPTADQLDAINDRLATMDEPTRDDIMSRLRIGVQWDTEVTIEQVGHAVTQVYGSALPVVSTSHHPDKWEPFAQLVLDASYEATLRVACLNAEATGNARSYLTMLGGGAFGNAPPWIVSAIRRSLRLFERVGLDIVIVSHGGPNRHLTPLFEPIPAWADALFEDQPRQWGLRGDPFLWAELRDALVRLPEPATEVAFAEVLWSQLSRLCGEDMSTTELERIAVQRYPAHGMSGGRVSPRAWSERLVPLLIDRFRTHHAS